MKHTIFTVIALLLFSYTFAENSDSIRIKRSIDKIESYISHAQRTLNVGNIDSPITYYNKAFDVALDNNLPYWKGEVYHNIGRFFLMLNKIDSAHYVFTQTLLYRKEAEDLIGLNKTLTNLCQIYLIKGGNVEGLEIAKEAIEAGKSANYDRGTGIAYLNAGHFLFTISRYEEALENFLEASIYFDKISYETGIGMCYNSMANIYMTLEKFGFALDYYNKNLELQKKIGNSIEIANAYLNLGSFFAGNTRNEGLYEHMDRDSMLIYFQKAQQIYQKLNNPLKLIIAHTNIALAHMVRSEYNEAFTYFDLAYRDAKKYNSISDIAVIENGYGLLYQKKGDYKQAKSHFLKSYENIIAANLKEKELMWYKSMAINSDSLREYKDAIQYWEKYINLQDTLREQESQKIINQLTMRYGSELKDQEIAAAKERQLLMQERNDEMEKRLYIIVVGLIFIGGMLILVLYSFIQKRKANALLIVQNEEIERQKNLALSQKNIIEEQQKNIIDSIEYARKIQDAILPQQEIIKELFGDSLQILFKPRDIVSGDFYWIGKKGNQKIVVAADCTGHGVPGAFMSMLGTAFLNEIVGASDETLTASEILNKLRENIISSLRQTGKTGEQKDGMDMALVMYNKDTNTINFAGANNPLIIIRPVEKHAPLTTNGNDRIRVQEFTNEITQVPYLVLQVQPDKMPIGIYEHQTPFTDVFFTLSNADTVYAFSDGYQDQFGGPNNKKFMLKRLKQLLVNIHHNDMPVQIKLLNDELAKWILTSSTEQIDDVLVVGFSTI